MPHSSGGGSSSGGGHGGSSSKSSSSKTRDIYFPSSRRFVYYYGDHPCYVYSDTNLKAKSDNPFGMLLGFLFLFIAVCIYLFFASICWPVSPLSNPSGFQSEIIDNIDIFSGTEENDLQKTLDEFTETTGVAVILCTDNNSVWRDSDSSLLKYSYDYYVDRFADEEHWVIFYTCDFDEMHNIYNWYWEGMQGNHTDDVLEVFLNNFNANLQARLESEKTTSVANAFNKSFSEANEAFRNQKIHIYNPEFLLFCISVTFPILFFPSLIIFLYDVISILCRRYKYKDLIEIPSSADEPETEACNFCGKKYVAHIHQNCPYCKARIVSKDDAENSLF